MSAKPIDSCVGRNISEPFMSSTSHVASPSREVVYLTRDNLLSFKEPKIINTMQLCVLQTHFSVICFAQRKSSTLQKAIKVTFGWDPPWERYNFGLPAVVVGQVP